MFDKIQYKPLDSMPPSLKSKRGLSPCFTTILRISCLIMTLTLMFYIMSLYEMRQYIALPSKQRLKTETSPNKNQQQDQRCPPIDYDEVVRRNSDSLPKREFSYSGYNAVCEGENSDNCIPKLRKVNHGQYYWVSNKAKILGCVIRKNMSQLFTAILCFLNDELKFLYSGTDLVRDVFHRGCTKDVFPNIETAKEANVTKKNSWSYTAIVRDPVDRFLSGFIYTCISGEQQNQSTGQCRYECHGCDKNMTCYLEKLHAKIRKMSKDPDTSIDVPTEHTYPQSWCCNFNEHFNDYQFLHYNVNSEKFYHTMEDYLKTRNVSQRALDYINVKMTSIRTIHSTALSSVRPFLEQRLRSSSYLMKLIMQIYYYDFKLFNFDLPEIPEN